MNQNTDALNRAGNFVLALFRQDHKAYRYRSRLWYLLPVLFSLPGGIVAFFAVRHDDPDKAKNCLLLGIILSIPFIALGVAAASAVDALDEVAASEFCAELSATANSVDMSDTDVHIVQILCD